MKTLDFILGVVPSSMYGGSKAMEMNCPSLLVFGFFIALFLLTLSILSNIKHRKL